MSKSITADVGSYGKVTGFTTGNVAEFRGIPFGRIPARFRRGELVNSVPGGTFDATKYGPYPPQTPEDKVGAVFLYGEYIKNFFAEEQGRPTGEDCLNLNIVTPQDAIGQKKLPVMVWIYGGAFCIGGNSKSMYNGVQTVEHSLEWNEPVVYVAINYRVNFFGFLASKELIKDNASHGGGVGNYGLHDQRLALEWIQKNIEYFGGDPSRVTIYGESAGSASVHSQILAGKPLFSRAIMQSGVLADCLGPMKVDGSRSQGDFDFLVKKFGLEDKDDQGKVDGLRNLPMEDLINAIEELGPFPVFYPVDDSRLPGHFFEKGRDETHQWLLNPDITKFVTGVIAGDCEVEGIIFARSLMSLDAKQVLKVLHSSLPDTLLENYGLATSQTSNVSSVQEILQQLINLKTDELFCASISRAARDISKSGVKVYTYHFDRGDQFQGPMNGVPHHAVDLEYMFGNFTKGFKDKKDVDLSKALMRFWIGFANGKEPWSEYPTGKALHITAEGECTVVPRDEIKSRRWAAYAEMENNWAQVRKTGNMLMNAKLEGPAV